MIGEPIPTEGWVQIVAVVVLFLLVVFVALDEVRGKLSQRIKAALLSILLVAGFVACILALATGMYLSSLTSNW